MNGRKAEEMYCGLIGGSKVKSGLAACPRLEPHPPQTSRCTLIYPQPAHQSAGQSVINHGISLTSVLTRKLIPSACPRVPGCSRYCPLCLLYSYERAIFKGQHSLNRLLLKNNTFDLVLGKNVLKLSSTQLNFYGNVITSKRAWFYYALVTGYQFPFIKTFPSCLCGCGSVATKTTALHFLSSSLQLLLSPPSAPSPTLTTPPPFQL